MTDWAGFKKSYPGWLKGSRDLTFACGEERTSQ